jgi:hypothetical protein
MNSYWRSAFSSRLPSHLFLLENEFALQDMPAEARLVRASMSNVLASTSKRGRNFYDRSIPSPLSSNLIEEAPSTTYMLFDFTNKNRYILAPSAFDLTNNFAPTLKAKSCHEIAILARGSLTKI